MMKKGSKEGEIKNINNVSRGEVKIPERGNIQIEKALVENFVSLQKVLTNLSASFNELSKKISKLLELFELSAKALIEKDFKTDKGGKNEKEIIGRLNNLLDQNKIIARGLALLHESNLGEEKQTPPQTPPEQGQRKNTGVEGYQKSISSMD
ncbi:MAG: hypothetical protein AABX28_01170 [Nanoarchaeota archaeon]